MPAGARPVGSDAAQVTNYLRKGQTMKYSFARLAPCVAATAVVALSLPVLAQVNGGSTSVRNGAGFNCAPGTAWITDGGVARCQTPTAPAPFLASCPSLSNFQPSGACQFDIPATGAGVTVTAPTKTTTHIGQTTLTCNAGAWGAAATSCTPIPTLSVSPGPGTVYQGFDYTFSWTSSYATSITWSCSGANPSSGSLAASGSRALSTPNIGTTSCQIEATGPGGSSGVRSFTFYTDTRPGCPSTSYSAGACAYDISARPDGASDSFGTSTPGYSGSISASCSLGSWTFGASSCAPVAPVNCSSQTLSGSGCSFSFGAMANGATSTVGTSTPGYSGTATASCSSGSLSLTGSSCAPVAQADCPAQVLWSGACSFSFDAVANGASSTVTNGVAGYTGSATASCSSGVLSFASPPTCAPSAPTDCSAATRTAGACSFSFGSIANGSSATVGTWTPGYTGSATASCTAGALSLNGSTCSPATSPAPAPSNCAAATWSSGACSYSVAALGSGLFELVSTYTPGYVGNVTATCSSGSVSWSGASCSQLPPLCTGGQSWSGSVCACPLGTSWNGSSCVTEPTITVSMIDGASLDINCRSCAAGPGMSFEPNGDITSNPWWYFGSPGTTKWFVGAGSGSDYDVRFDVTYCWDVDRDCQAWGRPLTDYFSGQIGTWIGLDSGAALSFYPNLFGASEAGPAYARVTVSIRKKATGEVKGTAQVRFSFVSWSGGS